MMEEFRQQAERFGTDIRFAMVAKVDFSGETKRSGWMVEKEINAHSGHHCHGATANGWDWIQKND